MSPLSRLMRFGLVGKLILNTYRKHSKHVHYLGLNVLQKGYCTKTEA